MGKKKITGVAEEACWVRGDTLNTTHGMMMTAQDLTLKLHSQVIFFQNQPLFSNRLSSEAAAMWAG